MRMQPRTVPADRLPSRGAVRGLVRAPVVLLGAGAAALVVVGEVLLGWASAGRGLGLANVK